MPSTARAPFSAVKTNRRPSFRILKRGSLQLCLDGAVEITSGLVVEVKLVQRVVAWPQVCLVRAVKGANLSIISVVLQSEANAVVHTGFLKMKGML